MKKLNKLLRKFDEVKRQWETNEDGFSEELDEQLNIVRDEIHRELDVQQVLRNINSVERESIENSVEW